MPRMFPSTFRFDRSGAEMRLFPILEREGLPRGPADRRRLNLALRSAVLELRPIADSRLLLTLEREVPDTQLVLSVCSGRP
jgi:hypothetical protein